MSINSYPFKRILKVVLYLFYLFFIIEGSSRLILSNEFLFRKISKKSICDVKYRIRWINLHRKENNEIVFDFDLFDRKLGWVSRKNYRSEKVNTNSKGVRGKREYPYRKDPQKTRILLIGDSFTFGEGLSDEETFGARLQMLLPNTEVINLGIHGYGHDQMLLYLKEEGLKYNPDIVILGYMKMDNVRNLLNFRDYAKPRYVIKNGHLKLTNVPLASPKETLRREKWRLKFIDLLSIRLLNLKRNRKTFRKTRDSITESILKEMMRTIESSGAVAVIAHLHRIRHPLDDKNRQHEENRFIDRWRKKGVRSISMLPVLVEAQKADIHDLNEGHFTASANGLIAKTIRDYLLKENLVQMKR